MFIRVSGKLTAAAVNVQNAIQIGKVSMEAYENELPQGVYSKISSNMSPDECQRLQTTFQDGGHSASHVWRTPAACAVLYREHFPGLLLGKGGSHPPGDSGDLN